MIKQDVKRVVALATQLVKPALAFYSSSGVLLYSKIWSDERIMGMGWTGAEQLVCVLETGQVRLYNLQGEYTQFSLGFVRF